MNGSRCLDDAGYLLGVLSPAERQEFRRHLRHCLRCRTSVKRLAPVLGLLALAVSGEPWPGAINPTVTPGDQRPLVTGRAAPTSVGDLGG